MISWLILTSTIPGSDNVDKNVILLGIYPLKDVQQRDSVGQ